MTTSKSAMKAGFFETTQKIYQREGVRAFYSGLMPAIVRGLFYGGVRLGKPIKIREKAIHFTTLL